MPYKDAEKRRAYSREFLRKYRKLRPGYDVCKVYGIDRARYELMVVEAGGKCAICLRAAPLVVDHDHNTGRVRGLLCSLCNSALGFFKDNGELLRAAVAYISK